MLSRGYARTDPDDGRDHRQRRPATARRPGARRRRAAAAGAVASRRGSPGVRRTGIWRAAWPSSTWARRCTCSTTGFSTCSWRATSNLLIVDRADVERPRLLPSGRLREPLSAARAADAVLVTGADGDQVASGRRTAGRGRRVCAAPRRRAGSRGNRRRPQAAGPRRARAGRQRHRAARAVRGRGRRGRLRRGRRHRVWRPPSVCGRRHRRASRGSVRASGAVGRAHDREGLRAAAAAAAVAVPAGRAADERPRRAGRARLPRGCCERVRRQPPAAALAERAARPCRQRPREAPARVRRRGASCAPSCACCPTRWCGSWARLLGLAFYALDRVHRRVAETNLATAFPNRSAADRQVITRAMFVHFGRLLLELLKFSTLDRCRHARAHRVRGPRARRVGLRPGQGRAVCHRALRLLGDSRHRPRPRAAADRRAGARAGQPVPEHAARAGARRDRQLRHLPSRRGPQGAARAGGRAGRGDADRPAHAQPGRDLRGLLRAAGSHHVDAGGAGAAHRRAGGAGLRAAAAGRTLSADLRARRSRRPIRTRPTRCASSRSGAPTSSRCTCGAIRRSGSGCTGDGATRRCRPRRRGCSRRRRQTRPSDNRRRDDTRPMARGWTSLRRVSRPTGWATS